MPQFSTSLRHWGTDKFSPALKSEINSLDPGNLPLAQGTTRGGMVDDSDIAATILKISNDTETIEAKVGVFFNEILAGCSCGDEPLSENAYCELLVIIDRQTAEVKFENI